MATFTTMTGEQDDYQNAYTMTDASAETVDLVTLCPKAGDISIVIRNDGSNTNKASGLIDPVVDRLQNALRELGYKGTTTTP